MKNNDYSYNIISVYNHLKINVGYDGIVFLKCHTLGNDFILAQDSKQALQVLPDLCKRRIGIGADDVILFNMFNENNYSMRIINPDGSKCKICGNALISFGSFLFYSTNMESVNIITSVGEKKISINRNDGTIHCNMGNIKSTDVHEYTITIEGKAYTIYHINIGTPHTIIYTDNLYDLDIARIGPSIEKHKLFPNRTNVMFAQIQNYQKIFLRCWEKGGTGETLACGTGACATALISQKRGLVGNNVDVVFQLGAHRIKQHHDTVELIGKGTLISCGFV